MHDMYCTIVRYRGCTVRVHGKRQMKPTRYTTFVVNWLGFALCIVSKDHPPVPGTSTPLPYSTTLVVIVALVANPSVVATTTSSCSYYHYSQAVPGSSVPGTRKGGSITRYCTGYGFYDYLVR